MNTVIGSLHEKMTGDYQAGKRIATLSGAHLHHARLGNGERVVLKQPQSNTLLPAQLSRFSREYELLRALDVEGIVKPRALAGEPTRPVIVLDYFDGESLETFLDRARLDVEACLRLGRELAHTLASLHAAGIIHRDIRPANLWLTPPPQHLLLLDLSLASDMQGAASGDDEASGDWAYRSPEQTGRMNRPVDYRTDMYSLGVTLYRMLTGQLPFHGNDALEWAHSHIARRPQPPAEVNAVIPQTVSDIVMKLLAKMPEDRYQSGYGLRHDLEICLAQWERHGTIAPFALGSQDVPDRLQIPQKLVGREAEIQQLLKSFDAMAASGRATLQLIAGSAGVGKSTLVHELRQPIIDQGGYFICGKFDQYQRDIPYATVTQAFRELVQQILAESEARIADWRRQIQEAVGGNGQLIVDVLPQVELIIGTQEPVPELPPVETQNRFRLVFEKFIGVFAQQAHPLTLFLDDLQWADTASLRMIRELLESSGERFLLLIGAYRDNEVDPAHPLILALDDMRKEGARIMQLRLAPWSEATLGAYLGTMLQCEHDAVAPLARLICQKTAGNPFFVIQFITVVVEERMVVYDAAAKTWRWDLPGISAKGYTDNVAELMVDKLTRLPAPAQTALQWLACLGSSAPEAILVALCGQPEEDTQAALSAAVRAGLILRAPGAIRFLHDRVREATYLAIPANERAALHLQIGRLLLAGKTQAQIEEAVFSIVDQFNRGADRITDANEKALLCHLNFLAGKKAKASIAYSSARSFLDRAMALSPANAWRTQYQNTFALTLALSECEYLVGNLERAEQLADLILANAQFRRDRAQVYLLRLQLYQIGGQYDDAFKVMLETARLFDMRFPSAVPEVEAAIEAEIRDISAYLQDRRIAEIANAALLDDADMGMAIAFLIEAFPIAYLIRPDYFTLIIARAVKLSLHYGNSEDACKAYSVYGCTLAALTNDISTGIEFSEMALELNRKLHGRRRTGRMLMMHACGLGSLKNAIADVIPTMDRAFAACIESGDLVYANYVAFGYFWFMLQKGDKLDEVWHTARRHGEFARQSHNETVYHAIRFQQQWVISLKGQAPAPASMEDADFDEGASWFAMEKAGFGLGMEAAYILKQISAFFYGDYTGALAAAQQAAKVSNKRLKRMYTEFFYHFYLGLTLAALYPQAPAAERRKFSAMLAEELARHKLWADHCPQNFLNCHALLGAEIARIEGRDSDAMRLYQQAIQSAHDNGFVQNEALAYELAATFYREQRFNLFADTYLREARVLYMHWGADGKVAQLDAAFPQLHTQPVSAAGVNDKGVALPLDVLSVAKASQAISSRIMLNDLSDTLLRIVLESAGAQTGSLVLREGNALWLAARATVDQGMVQTRFYDRKTPAKSSLPTTILNYVQHSKDQVLLPDVMQPNPFSTDAYFTRHRPKSVLCLPILRQDALIGVLYLENNLVTHAFAPERVAVLNLLASQAAISLENALLYADLKQENNDRKRAEDALRKAHDELEMRVRERTAALHESNHQLQGEILERQQAEADLARSNAELEQLAYVASHDLQEPLRMVTSYLQLLEQRYKEALDADAHEFIDFAVNGAKRMQSLINDLLTYSRIGTRAAPLQPVDCAAVISTVLHSLHMAIVEGDAHVTCDSSPVVLADATQLAQLFQNLLANAIKFRSEKPVRIHIAAQPEGDFWRFSVQDNGIGITPEYFERIFVMFQRLHSRRLYAGTGMGLAICKKIVERHGGHIWVESVPGQGSTFYFTLPRAGEIRNDGTEHAFH